MITARRPVDLFEICNRIQEAGIEIYNLAVSNHDLKPSVAFFRKFACDLEFAAYVFHGLFALRRATKLRSLQGKRIFE